MRKACASLQEAPGQCHCDACVQGSHTPPPAPPTRVNPNEVHLRHLQAHMRSPQASCPSQASLLYLTVARFVKEASPYFSSHASPLDTWRWEGMRGQLGQHGLMLTVYIYPSSSLPSQHHVKSKGSTSSRLLFCEKDSLRDLVHRKQAPAASHPRVRKAPGPA